jgi:DNA-binding CsgD family transcriptional regulator
MANLQQWLDDETKGGVHYLSLLTLEFTMLNRVGCVLLDLHRGCRQQTTEGFMLWAMARVQQVIPCHAWFWGSGTEIAGENIVHSFHFDHVPVGIEQILSIYVDNPATGWVDTISLYRSYPESPFSQEERRVLQCLVPHLIEARQINHLEHLFSEQPGAPQQHALGACDSQGVIHMAGKHFVELMHCEWPQWKGPCLPDTVLKSSTSAARCYVGQAISILFVPVFDSFQLKIRPRSLVNALSQRELEIARRFASGLTHKELARELGLSPSTVRNHLSSIYPKLGVGNKAELATLLATWVAG